MLRVPEKIPRLHCILHFHSWIRVASIVKENTLPREEKRGETLANTEDQLARKVQGRQSPGLSYVLF